METIKAITTIKDGSISFEGLEKLNNQEVEVFVYALGRNNSKAAKEKRKKFFKFQGIIDSKFSDTSKNVDRIVYGK